MNAPALQPQASAAIADDLALLTRLHDREVDADLIAALRSVPVADWFGLRMEGEAYDEALRLLNLALEQAPDPAAEGALDEMAAEYAAIYLNHTYRISPYESVWVDEDGLERQEPMFEVRAWFGKFGFAAPDWRQRADDHIAHELALLSHVAHQLEQPETARHVADFMCAHPLVWVPAWAGRVARRCQSPFYAGIALLTADYLQTLSAMLQRLYGFDMKPMIPERPTQASPDGPTCADPPPRYAPGAGPGW